MRRLTSLILLLSIVCPWRLALACDEACQASGQACEDRCECCGDRCECSSDSSQAPDHDAAPAAPSSAPDRAPTDFLPDHAVPMVSVASGSRNAGPVPAARGGCRHAGGRTVLLQTGHLLH